MSVNSRFFSAMAIALGCSLFATHSLAGESLDRIKQTGILKVATDPSWPPQSFLNDNNEMDGFDVDVAKEIARRLGVGLEFVTPEWDVITAGNWAGRWDLSVGSMTPTKERGRVLDFPAVYYYTPASFAVHEESDAMTKADLNGKRIGACTACTFELYLQHDLTIDAVGAPPFTYEVTPGRIVSLRNAAAILDDLRLGDGVRLDGMIDSLPAIREAIDDGYPIRVLGSPAFYEPLSVAIDKGDPEFNAAIADVIKSMHRDGVLSNLSQKWYGIDYSRSY